MPETTTTNEEIVQSPKGQDAKIDDAAKMAARLAEAEKQLASSQKIVEELRKKTEGVDMERTKSLAVGFKAHPERWTALKAEVEGADSAQNKDLEQALARIAELEVARADDQLEIVRQRVIAARHLEPGDALLLTGKTVEDLEKQGEYLSTRAPVRPGNANDAGRAPGSILPAQGTGMTPRKKIAFGTDPQKALEEADKNFDATIPRLVGQ